MSERLYNCSEIARILNVDRGVIRYYIRKLKIVHRANHGCVQYFDDEIIQQLMLCCGTFHNPDEVSPHHLLAAHMVAQHLHQQYISLIDLAALMGYTPKALQAVFKRTCGPKTQLFHNRVHYIKSEVLDWLCVEKPLLVKCVTAHFALTD